VRHKAKKGGDRNKGRRGSHRLVAAARRSRRMMRGDKMSECKAQGKKRGSQACFCGTQVA